LIAAFPLIYWYSNSDWIIKLLLSKWFWYAIIVCISYLMISVLPMMALKFTDYSFKKNSIKYILIIISVIAAILLQWLSVPIIFLLYVVLSLAFKSKQL
jgi:CDP-diacylglycerol--serine O-phosphatidyltransferase